MVVASNKGMGIAHEEWMTCALILRVLYFIILRHTAREVTGKVTSAVGVIG